MNHKEVEKAVRIAMDNVTEHEKPQAAMNIIAKYIEKGIDPRNPLSMNPRHILGILKGKEKYNE